jgi:hypothetical protein
MCLKRPYIVLLKFLGHYQKSEVTHETCQTVEAELFDTLDDLFAKFDNPLVHLAVNGIILIFQTLGSF